MLSLKYITRIISNSLTLLMTFGWPVMATSSELYFFDVDEEKVNIPVPSSPALVDLNIKPSAHETINDLEITWKCRQKAPVKRKFQVCNANLEDLEFTKVGPQVHLTLKTYRGINFNLRDEQTFLEGKKPIHQQKEVKLTCYPDVTVTTVEFTACN